MQIQVEINAEQIQKQVVAELVDRLRHEAREEMLKSLRALITQEIRQQMAKEVEKVVETMTLPDGRTVHQYVVDRLSSNHDGRMEIEARIARILETKSELWVRELVEPQLATIRENFARSLTEKIIRA